MCVFVYFVSLQLYVFCIYCTHVHRRLSRSSRDLLNSMALSAALVRARTSAESQGQSGGHIVPTPLIDKLSFI